MNQTKAKRLRRMIYKDLSRKGGKYIMDGNTRHCAPPRGLYLLAKDRAKKG